MDDDTNVSSTELIPQDSSLEVAIDDDWQAVFVTTTVEWPNVSQPSEVMYRESKQLLALVRTLLKSPSPSVDR